MLKKTLALLLSLVLTLSCSGCAEKEPKPLRICIDLECVYDLYRATDLETAVFDFETSLRSSAEITDYVIEYIPGYGPERDNSLDRIRTETMSGGGPDVFITQCAGGDPSNALGEALFQMPEKAMELALFLPLDEYIENAEHAEWDKFTQVVMDAGKNEEGQQLIPLTYSVHTAMYCAEDFSHTPSNMTWNEMLNNEELYDTAARIGDAETITRGKDAPLDYILGDLADYKDEKLLFTEEELYERVTEICELTAYTRETKPYYTEGWTEGSFGYNFNHSTIIGGYRMDDCLNGINKDDTLTFVPLYSDDGGCTALILAFAAVNRNTQRPQDAFEVIDLFLATGKQKNAPLFEDYIYRAFLNNSMPMHEEILSSKNPKRGDRPSLSDLSDENFAALSAVRDQITHVQFAGSLNIELEKMTQSCVKAYKNGEDYTDIVHNAYSTMKQMMAE